LVALIARMNMIVKEIENRLTGVMGVFKTFFDSLEDRVGKLLFKD
jgi:hypothetical protein